MSRKKKLIAWISILVPPGVIGIWHFGEHLHTLQWFIHLAETKYVRAIWKFLRSASGQTILLLGLFGLAIMILRELKARRKQNAEPIEALPPAAPAPPELAAPVHKSGRRVTLERTRTVTVTNTVETDKITLEEAEQPVEAPSGYRSTGR